VAHEGGNHAVYRSPCCVNGGGREIRTPNGLAAGGFQVVWTAAPPSHAATEAAFCETLWGSLTAEDGYDRLWWGDSRGTVSGPPPPLRWRFPSARGPRDVGVDLIAAEDLEIRHGLDGTRPRAAPKTFEDLTRIVFVLLRRVVAGHDGDDAAPPTAARITAAYISTTLSEGKWLLRTTLRMLRPKILASSGTHTQPCWALVGSRVAAIRPL
jgi:hypothetical protein